MSDPDYRALCKELADTLDYWLKNSNLTDSDARDLVQEARAALSQPEPMAPTDEELLKTYCDARRAFYFEHAAGDSPKEDRKAAAIWGLRAVLARWGTPANNTGGTH